MQREAGERAERADQSPVVARADGTGGVLDDCDTVALAEFEELVHVGRQPELVDRHDRVGAFGDRALGARPDPCCRCSGSMSAKTGVAPQCQTALAVAMNDSDGTITSSPGPTPDDVQRQMQRGRAAGCRDGVGGAHSPLRTRPRTPGPSGPGRPSPSRSPRRRRPPRSRSGTDGRTGPASVRHRERSSAPCRPAPRATNRRGGADPRRDRPRPRSRAASARWLVSARRRGTLDAPAPARTRPAGPRPSPRSARSASSSRLVSTPLATLNTSSRGVRRRRRGYWLERCPRCR